MNEMNMILEKLREMNKKLDSLNNHINTQFDSLIDDESKIMMTIDKYELNRNNMLGYSILDLEWVDYSGNIRIKETLSIDQYNNINSTNSISLKDLIGRLDGIKINK